MPYTNVPESMWGKMDDCVDQVMAKGHDKESAIGICHASIVGGQSALLEYVLSPEQFKISQREEISQADKERSVKEYGDVAFADPVNKKYPIDNEEHIRAAWNYINKEANAAKYSPVEVAAIKRRIVAAWKKKINPDGPPGAEDMSITYLIENFVNTQPGEPFRLFPFGKLVKGGKTHEITPEMARLFKLPHFKPPIKLGNHDPATPAGGHIIGLEVREDGLYALPELTEQGAKALKEGAYRYHSPEVIWDDGFLENPENGEPINGPLIVGDALLHTPHLGEAAALYSIEPYQEVNNMMDSVQVPTPLWEKFLAWFGKRAEEPTETPEPPEPVIPDEYTAAVKERDELKAKIDAMDAERANRERVDTFAAQLKETKVIEGAEMLAGMTDEQAAWVVEQFKALSAQINTGELFGEKGSAGGGADNPQIALHSAITAVMAEKNVDYNAAFAFVRAEHPELIQAAYK